MPCTPPARALTYDGEEPPSSPFSPGRGRTGPPPAPIAHSPAPPAPLLPLLDASLLLALAAACAACALRGSLLAAGALLLPLAALLRASWGTCAWLSAAHLRSHATPHAAARTAFLHRRNVGSRLPCPYPDGWYAVALSAELPPGALVDAVACGVPLVVFRPEGGGAPAVLDAYCAHNGAHLAHGGGRVEGDCVRCPFHGWRFDRGGAAVATGSGAAPPAGSRVRAWPVLERNGVVAVWMAAAQHKGGGGEPAPPWFLPPAFPALNGGAGAFTYHGFSEHAVPAHITELPENGADVAHLTQLHGDFVVAALRPWLGHQWRATWAPHPSEKHLATLTVEESVVARGGRVCGKPVKVDITQVGPSQVVLAFNVPGVGRVAIVETVTPQAPGLQRVLHAVYGAPGVPRAAAKAILWSTVQA
jgi:cholesterol 7-dehydrogenase